MGRIRIIALLAALLALATGFAACGGGGDGGGGGSSADAEEVFESASLDGVESGKLDLQIDLDSDGSNAEVGITGAFQKEAGSDLPMVDIEIQADEGSDQIEASFVLLSDRAYFGIEGTQYEVDPTTFGFLRSTIEQNLQASGEDEGETASTKACGEAVESALKGTFTEFENEGTAEVEGEETTKVGARVHLAAIAESFIEITEAPACSAASDAAGVDSVEKLKEQRDEFDEVLKDARASIYVGDDGLFRRATLDMDLETGDGKAVSGSFDLTISEVNEPQEIVAPADAKPLEGLFKQLGINPLELLEGDADSLSGLLEGIFNWEGGDSSSGSGSGSGSGGGVDLGDQKAYLECLEEAETAADLQDCADLVP